MAWNMGQINDLKPSDMVDLEIFYRNHEPGDPGTEPPIFNPSPRPNLEFENRSAQKPYWSRLDRIDLTVWWLHSG